MAQDYRKNVVSEFWKLILRLRNSLAIMS